MPLVCDLWTGQADVNRLTVKKDRLRARSDELDVRQGAPCVIVWKCPHWCDSPNSSRTARGGS